MPGSTAAINTGGKKHSLQGRNKAEQNCRRTQDVPHIKKKRPDKIGTLLLGECAVLFAPHTPQIKKETPPTCLVEFPFYAGGGGLPRTEQQPAGLIAPLLCRVVLFDPLTRRR